MPIGTILGIWAGGMLLYVVCKAQQGKTSRGSNLSGRINKIKLSKEKYNNKSMF